MKHNVVHTNALLLRQSQHLQVEGSISVPNASHEVVRNILIGIPEHFEAYLLDFLKGYASPILALPVEIQLVKIKIFNASVGS